MRRPNLHDYVSRAVLHLARVGRTKHHGVDGKFYAEYFSDKDWRESPHDFRRQMQREALADALRDLSPLSVVLDVGCGFGDKIASLPSVYTRIGMDYSASTLDLAKELLRHDVILFQASALSIPIADSGVDATVCLEVLEHLPDDRAALEEMARVVRAEGLLVISVPSTYYFADYFDLMGHYRHYTREELEKRLLEVNCRVVRYVDQHHFTQVLHYYPHAVLTGAHRLLNIWGFRSTTLYERPLLGRVYKGVVRLMRKSQRGRSQLQLARCSRSTFVVAQKGSNRLADWPMSQGM